MKYLEIKKDDLIFNIQKLKSHVAPAKIIAVLKGNAYGLDMVKFGYVLLENGVDLFAVSELSEALVLRVLLANGILNGQYHITELITQ